MVTACGHGESLGGQRGSKHVVAGGQRGSNHVDASRWGVSAGSKSMLTREWLGVSGGQIMWT